MAANLTAEQLDHLITYWLPWHAAEDRERAKREREKRARERRATAD